MSQLLQYGRHDITSTAELLNVRHAGAGLMYGNFKGPVEMFPCGLCERFTCEIVTVQARRGGRIPERMSCSLGIVLEPRLLRQRAS